MLDEVNHGKTEQWMGIQPMEPEISKQLDFGSRYVVAKVPSPDKEATAMFIYQGIICRFGCPDVIINDRVANFTADMLEDVLRALNIKHLLKTEILYNPQENELMERSNWEARIMLSDFPDENKIGIHTLYLSVRLVVGKPTALHR